MPKEIEKLNNLPALFTVRTGFLTTGQKFGVSTIFVLLKDVHFKQLFVFLNIF